MGRAQGADSYGQASFLSIRAQIAVSSTRAAGTGGIAVVHASRANHAATAMAEARGAYGRVTRVRPSAVARRNSL
jgi:hypothetical protein